MYHNLYKTKYFFLQSSQWPAGKVLGGSSRINFNIHVRGHVSTDYLSWKSGQEWSEQDIIYYFNKYEKADGTYNGKLFIFKIYIITARIISKLSLSVLYKFIQTNG